MSEAKAIDGNATEASPASVEATLSGGGTTLAPVFRTPSREVLMPANADQVVEAMDAYQALLPRLLDEGDYQQAGDGKFVKKSGWRKIARAFNLSVELVSVQVERDRAGKPTRAEAIAKAIAPNGQVQDADGYCSISEFTGKRASDSKLENTLRATATTRAKNRAIADLVGMGEVSAEEVTTGGDPPHGPAQSDEQKTAAIQALTELLGTDAARATWKQLQQTFGGYMPSAFAETACAIAIAAERKREEEANEEPVEAEVVS